MYLFILEIFIAECFHFPLRIAISKRLDVYLNEVSNWKDLAKIFKLSDRRYTDYLYATRQPSFVLLDDLSARNVSLAQFKKACIMINRLDIVHEIERILSNSCKPYEQIQYIRE